MTTTTAPEATTSPHAAPPAETAPAGHSLGNPAFEAYLVLRTAAVAPARLAAVFTPALPFGSRSR
jgi:hypothetical protein